MDTAYKAELRIFVTKGEFWFFFVCVCEFGFIQTDSFKKYL